jgi:hypothetical protein
MIWGAKVSAAAPLAPEFEPDVLRLTNAVIDKTEMADGQFVTQLFIQDASGQQFLLCTFTQENQSTSLNLEIDAEDSAKLVVRGPGTVHLTGHMDYLDDDDEDEISSDESPVPMAD